jgi:hypothetical protein
MPDKKKVALGKPLQLTDAELEELAKITPEDIREARKLWIESVDAELKHLLDVQEVTTG